MSAAWLVTAIVGFTIMLVTFITVELTKSKLKLTGALLLMTAWGVGFGLFTAGAVNSVLTAVTS